MCHTSAFRISVRLWASAVWCTLFTLTTVWPAHGQSTSDTTGASGAEAGDAQAPKDQNQPATPPAREPTERIETWGEFDPGDGFLIGRNSLGELSVSGYALVRYINQMPAEQTYIDHLGNEHAVDARNDIFPHRIIVFLKG